MRSTNDVFRDVDGHDVVVSGQYVLDPFPFQPQGWNPATGQPNLVHDARLQYREYDVQPTPQGIVLTPAGGPPVAVITGMILMDASH